MSDRIEKKVLLRASRQRVWRALADSKEFGQWFGVKFDAPFVPGAAMHGTMTPTRVDDAVAQKQKPYEGAKFEITIDRMEPETLFSFRWHPFAIDPKVDYSKEETTLVVFEITDAKGGVMLTVTESGFDRIPRERRATAFTANSEGWMLCTGLIEKYLEKGA